MKVYTAYLNRDMITGETDHLELKTLANTEDEAFILIKAKRDQLDSQLATYSSKWEINTIKATMEQFDLQEVRRWTTD